MESNFYNEEFEDLIRQKADQYKMYPSDKVWKNIHSSLHTRRKWFIAGMFSLITGILFFAGKGLLAPSAQINTSKKLAENNISPTKKMAELSITPAFQEFKASGALAKPNGQENEIANEDSILNIISNYLEKLPNTIDAGISDNNNDEDNIVAKPHRGFNTASGDAIAAGNQGTNIPKAASATLMPALLDDASNSSTSNWEDKKQIGLLQNSAPYELASLKKLNRKYWQLYLSPTASYRQLSGGDIYANMKTNLQNGPIAATTQNSNLNQYINNKPAVGFEVGGSFLYRLTRNLSLKAGLQFNYSSYNINAYASTTQPATIALNSYYGFAPNTITSYTNIGTIGGKAAVNIKNQYYQLSAPVGFELRIMGNEKLQLHIGATVQPTYLLNRNSYLLTADYTNYTQEPSLFRRWNINGAVEAFVSYKTGSIRWQIGPQFRYQLLSTYTSQYPINENLKEFGVKLGISKTIF
jgi:outer membrane protein with beta-barrel domain